MYGGVVKSRNSQKEQLVIDWGNKWQKPPATAMEHAIYRTLVTMCSVFER